MATIPESHHVQATTASTSLRHRRASRDKSVCLKKTIKWKIGAWCPRLEREHRS
jgi:hypothetical protein